MTDTKVSDNTDVSGDTNDKSENEGAGTDNSNNSQVVVKTFTQADVNNIIKQKQAEWKSKYKTEFDKTLEGKVILTEDERNTLIKDAVSAALNEEKLNGVRKTIQAEYKLNDYQVSKLEGGDEKSLREDAEKTYGKPKKEAPVLNSGTRQQEQDDNESRNERLKKQLVRKRDWVD